MSGNVHVRLCEKVDGLIEKKGGKAYLSGKFNYKEKKRREVQNRPKHTKASLDWSLHIDGIPAGIRRNLYYKHAEGEEAYALVTPLSKATHIES